MAAVPLSKRAKAEIDPRGLHLSVLMQSGEGSEPTMRTLDFSIAETYALFGLLQSQIEMIEQIHHERFIKRHEEKRVTDMTQAPITLTITGDTCTLAIDPDAYLRVKTYHPSVRVKTLQGVAYEQALPKNATTSFPLPKPDQSLRIDIYSGDGEGTGVNYAVYTVEESGLVLKEARGDYHIEVINTAISEESE